MNFFKRREAPVAQLRVDPVLNIPVADAPKPTNWVNVARNMGLDGGYGLDSLNTTSHRFEVAKPLPGVVPDGETPMAMDDSCSNSLYQYSALNVNYEHLYWPGIAVLSELAQRAEYRRISDTMAREMTREWIEIQSTGDDEDGKKAEKIDAIKAEFKRLDVQGGFRKMALMDGLFGRGHLFLDFGDKSNMDLKIPLVVDPKVIGTRKPLKSLKTVEPIWTYPNDYNSVNPIDPDFYKPRSWFVSGTTVNATRLLTFVAREMPDLLKPAYGFAGLSLTQMAIPYVTNWLRTRQSVSDLLHSFSVSVLSTDLSVILQGGGAESLIARAQVFNQARDNRGLMMVDKDREELTNVSAPLGSLDRLQAQAQEQMASVSGEPLVKLLGITPSGLNASSDGEIRVFYDTIAADQQNLFAHNLEVILQVVQLSLFDEIDPDITFTFVPLWQLDAAAEAAINKTKADTYAVYSDAGVLAPIEERERIARDPMSGYNNIKIDDAPEVPTQDDDENADDEHAESGTDAKSGV